MAHQFHIPVLGLGFSIDTPLKVAKYGISSVVSIVDDELIERMRKYHSEQRDHTYLPIAKKSPDSRSNRICAYLNTLADFVNQDFEALQQLPFEPGNELCRYFELLPDESSLKHGYELMMEYPEGESKRIFQQLLRKQLKKGTIDVNIMSKVDRLHTEQKIAVIDENSDALSAFRGFAKSKLRASVILSAGMNPRLYSYIEQFQDFFPNGDGEIKKQIILKVSDFRSAYIQAKFLAKKGLWVSEFRVESGLNCGGHAFATTGNLLGPILEEFKAMKASLQTELFTIYQDALANKRTEHIAMPVQRLSVQGGIGTAQEAQFLRKQYALDSTGWGSPFLLVPEVTNVDKDTLNKLADANENAFYLSNSSPLGVLFNNFKGSSIYAEQQKRIAQGRPGSPCTKKYLCSNTEFTAIPICTASREYQNLKIKELQRKTLNVVDFEIALNKITEKVCLCEGLCSSTYQKLNILKPKESKAVAICPGPNLAYFSSIYSLDDMVGHIYGRQNLLEKVKRPHVLIKELDLYINYFKTELKLLRDNFNEKKKMQLLKFKEELLQGIAYYKNLFNCLSAKIEYSRELFEHELQISEIQLQELII